MSKDAKLVYEGMTYLEHMANEIKVMQRDYDSTIKLNKSKLELIKKGNKIGIVDPWDEDTFETHLRLVKIVDEERLLVQVEDVDNKVQQILCVDDIGVIEKGKIIC